MPLALERAALQFQSPVRSVDVALSGATYTMRRDIGSGRYWAVDLTGETVGEYLVRSLASHRIEGDESVTLGVTGSAWEYALVVSPSGGTPTFIGSRAHGYERDDSIAVAVDGAAVTPTETPTAGKTVTLTRNSTLFHPDAVGAVGTSVVVYTMNHVGLDVSWTITWSQALTAGQCYGAMFPVASVLDTGKTTSGSKVTLTANNDSQNSSSKSVTAWLWDADGNYGACMALRDLATVRDWESSDDQDMWIQDRTNTAFNKVYAGYDGPAISAGDVWTGGALYMADYFSATAASTLDF